MINGIADGIQTRGGAEPDNETEVLASAASVAYLGADGTKDMVSKFGRSRVLERRAIGHIDIDPVAASAQFSQQHLRHH